MPNFKILKLRLLISLDIKPIVAHICENGTYFDISTEISRVKFQDIIIREIKDVN